MQTFKLRLVLCDALLSDNVKTKLETPYYDELIQRTEPVRKAILTVDDDNLIANWREWDDTIQGKRMPIVRAIDNDPMQAFINATF